MIVLNLRCAGDHRFEGWFRSAEDFAGQNAQGQVECPVCGIRRIERLPSGPHVRRSQEAQPPATSPNQSAKREVLLRQWINRLIRESEDVGERFPEEARKIHYEEAPARSIRGVASREEAKELNDEGIDVLLLPLPPTDEVH